MDELRRSFHDQLAVIHGEVEEMARVAAQSVTEATTALLTGDVTAAGAVRDDAALLTNRTAALEREVYDVIARQAPVSRDLRLLMASLRVGHELRLCGGLSVAIARRTGRIDPAALTETLRAMLYELGAESSSLLAGAAGAYAAIDDRLAMEVLQSDESVRSLHRRFLATLFLLQNAPVESAVEMGLIARSFERITDHALEIADRVRFVVSAYDLPGST
jgi:phosphate transport system protein